MQKQELVRVDPALQYPIAQQGDEATRDLVLANIGGVGEGSVFDLDQVRVPSGGETTLALPGLKGPEAADCLLGIIILWQDARGRWPGDFAGSEPPQCAAEDGRVGVGDPGGLCRVCPYAAWGSDEKKGGRGQACKQMRRLFIVRPGACLPVLFTLPPTSIRACRKYFTSLTSARLPYWGVVTEIRLEKASNRQGIPYGRATFNVAEFLTPDGAAAIRAYADGMRAALLSVPVGEERGTDPVPVEAPGMPTEAAVPPREGEYRQAQPQPPVEPLAPEPEAPREPEAPEPDPHKAVAELEAEY